jgi:oligoribonuclease NrnB/cAMP/cGMP phosphodiesterase (DHH superfamily)
LDNSKSGAMIAWEYFHPATEVPMLIKHIDDYDRWQFKIEGTKEFNKALWSYAPWSFEQWKEKFFYQIGFSAEDGVREKPLIDMKMEGAAILRAHDANVKAVVKSVARKCMLQYKVNDTSGSWHDATYTKEGLAANCPPHLSSDVGHQLANQSGTYGLLWFINKEGKCLCSLRSNSDYDVSAIAKTFGGGGHKNAAGFEVDIQTLLGWIK